MVIIMRNYTMSMTSVLKWSVVISFNVSWLYKADAYFHLVGENCF